MRRTLLTIGLLCLALAGCGGQKASDVPNESADLVLDFTPNAVHAGIYMALARDYDGDQGVTLNVRAPSSSTDSVKLLVSGRTQFAVLDIHDLAIAREKGRDVVGVMPLVQQPLAAVMAQPGIRRPRDLEGRRVGVTGLPSDDAVLNSIVRGDGGDPAKVRRTTIGFEAVAALLARRVDGATAFWNAEGVALRARRPGIREFRVDQYGAPAYPELVLATSRQTLREDPALVRATVAALRRGYTAAIEEPDSAVEALVERAHVDRAATTAELSAVSPAFQGDNDRPGIFDVANLRRWAAWEARFVITKRPPAVGATFATSF